MVIKRNTIQRNMVLDAVNKIRNHATADEIYDEIHQSHINISRATVYRNLNQLSESGEIKKVEVPNGADRFDHMIFNHYHAKCSACGKVFDVNMKYMDDLEKSIVGQDEFAFSGHDIVFSGICSKCRGQ